MTAFPIIGSTIIELGQIDSTNNYAMELAAAGNAEHGTVVTAQYQTKGRGQHGNNWQSAEGENLLFSIILNTAKEKIEDQFLLNAVFCSALTQLFMEQYELPDTCVKWPNDIFINKKKIAGTLIENVIRGQQWQYAIVGIGINVNQKKFSDNIAATSLYNILERNVALHEFRKKVFDYLNIAYHHFLHKRSSIISEYNKLLHGFEQEISFTKNDQTEYGMLQGAEPQGFLRIDNERYRHGEIKLLF